MYFINSENCSFNNDNRDHVWFKYKKALVLGIKDGESNLVAIHSMASYNKFGSRRRFSFRDKIFVNVTYDNYI